MRPERADGIESKEVLVVYEVLQVAVLKSEKTDLRTAR